MRAFGRSLGDFETLSPAERILLDCCRRGKPALVAGACPEEESETNRIRAGFIRFLALGGDGNAPVHEEGVVVRGAWLTGHLHLDGARVQHPIFLYECRIERMSAIGSTLRALYLHGSRLSGEFNAAGTHCEGSIIMRDGFHASGKVHMLYSTIDGNLDCTGGRFDNKEDALVLETAVIKGAVMLRDGFQAGGRVSFAGSTIGNDLDCSDGEFVNMEGGVLDIRAAKVGGHLICSRSRFQSGRGYALDGRHANVTGTFYFTEVLTLGSVMLDAMHVGALCDDRSSWPSAPSRLALDGFTYARFADGAPTDANTRIAWLERQFPSYLDAQFRTQPWEQLVAVLRMMGLPADARAVAMAKQRKLRQAGKVVRGAGTLHRIYGLTVGYGYRPLRLLVSIALVWLVSAYLYAWAAAPGGESTRLIAPPNRQPSAACLIARAQARSGDPCPTPAPDYRTFVPLVYSADVLLPVVDFGYQEDWEPVVSDRDGNPLFWGQALRFIYWFEIAFGWVASLLLVGALGTLIKKD